MEIELAENSTQIYFKEKRKSNIELLRIICMILIIAHHYTLYSGFEFSENISVNKLIVQILRIGGKVGVNVFILITGYFSINSEFKIKKFLNLIMQVFTYTFSFLILSLLLKNDVSVKQIIQSIFPITYSQYWFITTYIILYIFSPYLNKFIQMLKKQEMGKLLIMLIVFESILPTFIYARYKVVNNLLWFITLYMLGAYIQKYYKKSKYSIKINSGMIIFGYLAIIISAILLDVLSNRIQIFETRELYFAGTYSTLVLASSLGIFLMGLNIKLKENRIINKIASTVFGIYIIHENTFMRKIIWENIFNGSQYMNSSYLIVNAIISIISVFVISSLIELIRQEFLGKYQNKLVNKIEEKLLKIKDKKIGEF